MDPQTQQPAPVVPAAPKTENDKAIEILGKVIVKLQELVNELQPPTPPKEKTFFGLFNGGKKVKKGKKVKGGADIDMSTKSSMVYNTSDLMSGVSSNPPNVMNDGRVTSLQYMPQPFSAGNTFNFVSPMKDVLDATDYQNVTPAVAGGAKKKSKPRKSKH
jgi:hypothetical protein